MSYRTMFREIEIKDGGPGKQGGGRPQVPIPASNTVPRPTKNDGFHLIIFKLSSAALDGLLGPA